MREIIAGAASGSSAVLPAKLWPLVTISRFVPSLSISSSSPAWEDEDRPSTATIAATPIAIPSADSAARVRLVRSPTLATRPRSPGRSRAGTSLAGVLAGSTVALIAAGSRSFVDEREGRRPRVAGLRLDHVAAGLAVGGVRGRHRDAARVRPHVRHARLARVLSPARTRRDAYGEATAGPGCGCGERHERVGDAVALGVADGECEADGEAGAHARGLRRADSERELGRRPREVAEGEYGRCDAAGGCAAVRFAGARAPERGARGERPRLAVGGEGRRRRHAGGVAGRARLARAARKARVGARSRAAGARVARARGGGGGERERDAGVSDGGGGGGRVG